MTAPSAPTSLLLSALALALASCSGVDIKSTGETDSDSGVADLSSTDTVADSDSDSDTGTDSDSGTGTDSDSDSDSDGEELLPCVAADPAVGDVRVALTLAPQPPPSDLNLDLPCTFAGVVVDGPKQTMNLECTNIDDTMLGVAVEITEGALPLPTLPLGAPLELRAVEREAENYYISVAVRRSGDPRLLVGASQGPAVTPSISHELLVDFWAPFAIDPRKSDCADSDVSCSEWLRSTALLFHHTPSDALSEVFRRNLAVLDDHVIQVGTAQYEWGDGDTCDGHTETDYHFLIVDGSV